MAAKRKQAGRPVTMKDGRRVNVYLDAASIRAAKKLGHGNVSEGARIALRAILSTTDTEVSAAPEIFPGTTNALAKLSIKPKERLP